MFGEWVVVVVGRGVGGGAGVGRHKVSDFVYFSPEFTQTELFTYCSKPVRGSCKKFCHCVRITSVLRFIKHIFITNLQSIPPLLKHIFVTFLPSREKQTLGICWRH